MRRALSAALLIAGLAPPAAAEEWYDAYGSGLEALRHKQGAKAVEAFRRALQLRREPGVNVITYGTNKLDRYSPYLRLAESYLLMGDLEAAREALKRSEAAGRESAVERAGIAMLVESASEKAPPIPPPALAVAPAIPLDPDLLAAIRQVEQGRYEAGIAGLEAVVRRLRTQGEGDASSQVAQAYLYLGIAYIGRSQEERLKVVPRAPRSD